MMRKMLFALVCFSAFSGKMVGTQPQDSIQAVVFDFGGVVAYVDRSELVHFLKESFCLSNEQLTALLSEWKDCLVEKRDEVEFWSTYALSKDIVLCCDWFDQFERVKAFSFQEIPQTKQAIEELKLQGYRVAMLSNVNEYHADVICKLGFYESFDPLLLSYEIGVEKPDPRAYEVLIEVLDLPPSAILFIDDREENVEAAKELGIPSILFSNPNTLENELKKHGVHLEKRHARDVRHDWYPYQEINS